MSAKRKQVCFKKIIKRWHNACKTQANVLAFRQRFARVWLKKKLNAGKMPAEHKQMCSRFARVSLKKKLNAGKMPAKRKHTISFSLERDCFFSKGGPFKSLSFSNFHQSPLGLVPKRDGKFRLIHHLSYPAGESVNDSIPEYYTSVKYQTLDNAIDLIQKLGKGCLITKADIQDTFRLIPIRSEDHHLLGFKFEGNYY